MIDVFMPPLSQTMDSMLLVEWLKHPGDPVTKGEPLFLVESDKATLEVESPASGTLFMLLAEAGADVPVKTVIARIAAPGEVFEPPVQPTPLPVDAFSAAAPAPDSPALSSPVALPDPSTDRIPLPSERAARVFASPRARQTANALHVSLAEIPASGPEGLIIERDVIAFAEERKARQRVSPVAARAADQLAVDLSTLAAQKGDRITRADVEAAASGVMSGIAAGVPSPIDLAAPDALATPNTMATPASPASMASDDAGVPLGPTRRTIARRLSQAHQTVVPVTLTREVDATELVALHSRLVASVAEAKPRPSLTDVLAVIAVRCLRLHPALNGTFDGERIFASEAVHLALAVDTERGLLAPVIPHCERLGVGEVAEARVRIAAAARAGTITSSELAGGTFTLTNLGPLRVDAFTPVVNAPQIAILGTGRVRQAPAVFEGQVAIRQLMVLSLTFDHRVVDGAPAARFLDDIASLIENPDRLWLLPT